MSSSGQGRPPASPAFEAPITTPTSTGAPLRRTAGWVLLWALGVGYVISGDYFGWNFGLRPAGHVGLLVATAVMGVMYTALIFTMAELACATPVAGGPFAFARRALGPAGGFLTGIAVTLEYTIAPAVIAAGMAGYVAGWVEGSGADPAWVHAWVPPAAYAACVAINLAGAAVSLRALLVVTALAAAALVAWAVGVAIAMPDAGWSRLGAAVSEVPPATGVMAALPAAGWFFLAIEGVPMAAEETRDPIRDLPRGMIAAMASLVVLALIVLVLAPAAIDPSELAGSANPLPAALEATLGRGVLYDVVTGIGLLGLFASMLSIVYACSRQVFALARAGHLPPMLARTNRRGVPHVAIVVPACVGWAILRMVDAVTGPELPAADVVMQVAVFGALVSYVAVALSHLVLRRWAPALPRPYRTPGGVATSGLALALALLALGSGVTYGVAGTVTIAATLGVFALAAVYFVVVVRPRIAGRSVDDELAIVRAAESGD